MDSPSDESDKAGGRKIPPKRQNRHGHSFHTTDSNEEPILKRFEQLLFEELSLIGHPNRQKVRVKVGRYLYTQIDKALANNASDSDNSDVCARRTIIVISFTSTISRVNIRMELS